MWGTKSLSVLLVVRIALADSAIASVTRLRKSVPSLFHWPHYTYRQRALIRVAMCRDGLRIRRNDGEYSVMARDPPFSGDGVPEPLETIAVAIEGHGSTSSSMTGAVIVG